VGLENSIDCEIYGKLNLDNVVPDWWYLGCRTRLYSRNRRK